MIKHTEGFVTQEFDADGYCIGQRFFAGDVVTYYDNDGNEYNPTEKELSFYHPFNM